MNPKKIIAIISLLSLLFACGSDKMSNININEIERAIEKIDNKTIFFGHQSVGANILQGIKYFTAETEKQFSILSLKKDIDYNNANIIDTYIGENTYPQKKIDDFAKIIRSKLAGKVDIAFMKFCYVDSGHDMSAAEIFSKYIGEMEKLEKEFPQVTFVYVTMPLTGLPNNIIVWAKNAVKMVLGRQITGRKDNIERNIFNKKLREAKANTNLLFDLAKIESTLPNGKKETFVSSGNTYNVMAPIYTDDGGHLNKVGRKHVAKELLLFLANIN